MELLSAFLQHVTSKNLFNPTDRLLLAVSGGIDSVVLAHLCKAAGYTCALAHCNFGLRGAESERDETFVRKLAEDLQIPFHTKKFDTKLFAKEKGCSIQMAARLLRYEWFDLLLRGEAEDVPKAYDYLATAHHSDDNVETVLMNFCKGTGVRGLSGIPEKRRSIVRPLLFASRKEIADYAAADSIKWVEDSSNSEEKYTRNYFRKTIVPQIQILIPEAAQNIRENIDRFLEVGELYEQALAVHKQKLLEYRGDEVHIPVLKLARVRPLKTIVYEIIQAYGFSSSQAEGVIQLLHSETGRYIVSSTHRILRNRAWIIIAPLNGNQNGIVVVGEGVKEVTFPGGILEFRDGAAPPRKGDGEHLEMIDAAALQYPLLLRRWKEGDYFYPLGMSKKKKLGRFFIDQKFSKLEKERVWVLESARRIVWVLGHRIDNRFKVTPASQKVLHLRLRIPGTASPTSGKSQ